MAPSGTQSSWRVAAESSGSGLKMPVFTPRSMFSTFATPQSRSSPPSAGDGTSVRANLGNVDPDPEHVSLGMKVRLATMPIGTDENGTEAIGFGFEPLGG